MADTDWVEEVDGADVEPPKTPRAEMKAAETLKADAYASANSEAAIAAEEAYVETIKSAGV